MFNGGWKFHSFIIFINGQYNNKVSLAFMRVKPIFTEQSREDVVRSVVNNSQSKQLWSFSKKERFDNIKTECPVAFYQNQVSTIGTRKAVFATSKRKIFTQITDAPLPGTYDQEPQISIRGSVFGESRDKCAFRSYLSKNAPKIPGPNQYEAKTQKRTKAFSLRPKTANHRNYFIDDKEKQMVPSPFEYFIEIEHDGRTVTSKFKSTVMGASGLRRTQPRFCNAKEKSPGPSLYHPRTVSLRRESTGGAMSYSPRRSFIDLIKSSSYQPGPGNYKLPTQFGHYKRMDTSLGSNKIPS